jgi:shikimate kinase
MPHDGKIMAVSVYETFVSMDFDPSLPLELKSNYLWIKMLKEKNFEGQGSVGVNSPKLVKTIALIGLMGAGKSTVGRRLAHALGVNFVDADDEIVIAAGRTIPEIFQERGEEEFRAGERRVIARLLEQEPRILATGGGAFMNPLTRILMREKAITIWLRADIDVLMHRVMRRVGDRPLLVNDNPRKTMQDLMAARYPIYEQADIIVDSIEGPHSLTVNNVLRSLKEYGALENYGTLHNLPQILDIESSDDDAHKNQ